MAAPRPLLRFSLLPRSLAPQARQLLLAGSPCAWRAAALADAPHEGKRDLLAGARRGPRLAAATLARVSPGRAATVWVPRTAPGEPASTARGLLQWLLRRLAGRGVRLAQALTPPGAAAEEQLLCRCGFRLLAEVDFLAAGRRDFPQAPPGSLLQFEPYRNSQRPRLARVLCASYEQTQDAPLLNGARRIDDVLAGYAAASPSGCRWWFLVRHAGADAGCLLLGEHAAVPGAEPRLAEPAWELLYMGLKPQLRGRGLGMVLVRHAQWLAGQAAAAQLLVSVDVRNGPAQRIYAGAGFHAWDRRAVFFRLLRRRAASRPH